MPFALDTTIIVASLCSWHPRHDESRKSIESLLNEEPPLILPAPVLIEAFSVLTRLPPPHRVSSANAFRSLRDSFQSLAIVPTIDGEAHWEEIERASAKGIGGGAIHDAIIARCAREAGAKRLLTLNPAHFARFSGSGLTISVPGEIAL